MYIRKYNEYKIYNKKYDLVLKKGTVLYHGTIENIVGKFKVGIDGVFWTSDNKNIASTYISSSGSTYLLHVDNIYKPTKDKAIRNLQHIIGIEYDYDNIEFDKNVAVSYSVPEVFSDINNICQEFDNKLYTLYIKMNELKKKYLQMEREKIDDGIDEVLDEWGVAEDEYLDMLKKSSDYNYEYKVRAYINDMMMSKMKYKPYHEDNNGNNSYKVKFSNDKPLMGDEKEEGKVYTLKLNRDIVVYDYTLGGSVEGDLTDLDYNKIDLFEKVCKGGYDAIKINDFAQHDKHGNYGHTSIGFFRNTINVLDVVNVEVASHPDKLI